jgi:hypothetical protein
MSRDDEIVYASVTVDGYTYQAVNEDASEPLWMIRKLLPGGWDEFGILKKDAGPAPNYWAGPRGGWLDGTIMWDTAEDALRFAARGFR